MATISKPMDATGISAYVPCFNNAATLSAAIESIRRQTVPVEEFFVVDDGSTDGSLAVAKAMGVEIIQHAQNLGRGEVRARAVERVRHDLVLSCDATNSLPVTFCERALQWFESGKVAAVFGRILQSDNRSVVSRWRGRHLFKAETLLAASRRASLFTAGVMMRRSHTLAAGNFDATLRHSEDTELGVRLLSAGYEVVFDPELAVMAVGRNTISQVLERYWRWYAGKDERVTWKGYGKQIVYAFKVMAVQDLRARDPLSIPISLFSPHYQFWRSWCRQRTKRQRC